jgi:DNA helicase II / ATP-dependent DNA helicase PcrA
MVHGQSRFSKKSEFFDDLPDEDLYWLTPKDSGYNTAYNQALSGVVPSWVGRSDTKPWDKDRAIKRFDDADTGRGAQVFAAKILAKKAHHSDVLWRVGQMVSHAKFGQGSIMALEGTGNDARAKINFSVVGVKVLILNLAKLERV